MKKKLFYNTQEVADLLGVVKNTLYNWENAGKIPKAKRDPMNNYRIYDRRTLKRLKKITGRG